MIQLKEVTKIYNQSKSNEFEALHKISLAINAGEMVAIIGKSGAGKSTLLYVLSCIDSYEAGEYFLGEKLIKSLSEKEMAQIRNEKIGLVMQDFALVEDMTAAENVALPLNFAKKKIKNRRNIVTKVLEEVGIGELGKKTVNKLSGGQKQRVAIARAIVNNPEMILADEPTGALDSKTADGIMELFHTLHKAGKTIIIVTHDMQVANQCERKIEIVDGTI